MHNPRTRRMGTGCTVRPAGTCMTESGDVATDGARAATAQPVGLGILASGARGNATGAARSGACISAFISACISAYISAHLMRRYADGAVYEGEYRADKKDGRGSKRR